MNRILGQSLPRTIQKNTRDIQNFSTFPINSFQDWALFTEPMSYLAVDEIQVDNALVDLRSYFSIGNPLRYKQGGGFKYGWVTQVTQNTLRVNGGTDFTITNSAITDISKGISVNPIGFPYSFNFDPNWRTPGTNRLAGAPFSSNYRFWLTGSIVYVDLHFNGDDLSSTVVSVVGDLPTAYDVSSAATIPFFPGFAINNFKIQTAGAKIGSSANFDIEVLIIENPGVGGSGTGDWLTSTNGVGLDLTFGYLIGI